LVNRGYTTAEQAFGPDHLSRLPLGPGPKVAFVQGPMASQAGGVGGVAAPFCPSWSHQPGQKVQQGQKGGLWSRLVSPTGTKLLGPLIPFSGIPPPARAIQLTFVLVVLARVGGVLAHLLTPFVKDLDSLRPSISYKGLELVPLIFHCLSSSFYALEIEKCELF